MPQTISVRLDARDFIHDMRELSAAIEIANAAAVARIRQELYSIIRETFETAIGEADFPTIYANHLRLGINSLSPTVYQTNDGLVAEYYDLESMGDYQLLEEGFHYHAILEVDKNAFSVSNPPRVEIPYTGEPLYNEFEKRYDFWQALVNGEDYEVTFGKGKSSHTKFISTAGLYEETLRARVRYWGDRYPEWLLLEYGQDFYPESTPTHFKELTEIRVQEYLQEVYEEIVNSVIDAWNQPTVTRNAAGRLIDAETGRFVKYLPEDVK